MALYFQCFFCNRTVPVYRENEVKHVNCPECGARIDVDPEMATSPAIPKPGGCSCSGCLIGIFILAAIGIGIYSFVSKEKLSFQTIEKSRVSSRSKYYVPSEQEGRRIVSAVVAQERAIYLASAMNSFQLPESWKERFDTFNPLLKALYVQKRHESTLVQGKMPNRLAEKVWNRMKSWKFKSQMEFRDKAKYTFGKCLQEMEEANSRDCMNHAKILHTALHRYLFESPVVSPELSLRDALLQGHGFAGNASLFSPSSFNCLYWDWSIGIHYGVTTTKISEISRNTVQLIAWEKVPSQGRDHLVLLSDGTIEKWAQDRLYRTLGK